ncbi:hypothetical protein [Pseudomonas lactis]|uniref:Uncharacterized protein n=1 Tax=Pseudomonas lactis TaxID=1615674 RepID=A0A7Y1QJC8_9PSED|nr:hypothetical protein [Pseudomonas lactis]NNA83104.1 hypothetical protein [Pseudomonas lactis]
MHALLIGEEVCNLIDLQPDHSIAAAGRLSVLERFPDVSFAAVLLIVQDFVMLAIRPRQNPDDVVMRTGRPWADLVVTVLALPNANPDYAGKALDLLEARFVRGQRDYHFPLEVHVRSLRLFSQCPPLWMGISEKVRHAETDRAICIRRLRLSVAIAASPCQPIRLHQITQCFSRFA